MLFIILLVLSIVFWKKAKDNPVCDVVAIFSTVFCAISFIVIIVLSLSVMKAPVEIARYEADIQIKQIMVDELLSKAESIYGDYSKYEEGVLGKLKPPFAFKYPELKQAKIVENHYREVYNLLIKVPNLKHDITRIKAGRKKDLITLIFI